MKNFFKSSFVFIYVALVFAHAEIRFEPAGSRIVPLSAAQRSAPVPTSLVTCHHLKWITNQTKFPIEMSVPIQVDQQQQQQQQQEETSSYWDWLRLNDFEWVSKMKELLKSYLVTETRDRSSFMILNYDNRTHEQLGSYEPRLRQRVPLNGRESVVELSAGFTNKRDIFTLAYLKDHYIKTEKFPDRMKVTCYADFLIANTTMVDTIMSLMERYASFKMAVKSSQTKWAGPAPGPRFASHNRNHVRPQQQQLQPQQLQQIREMKEQFRQQQLQKIQRLQQQQQMDQQFQQIQQQLQQQQQIKQMQQQQQQQHPLMDFQTIIEKLVSYQQPPAQLLERERQQQLLQRQTQQLIEQHQLIQQQQKEMHQLQRQQQQQPIVAQVQQQGEQQAPVFKPAEQQVDADDAQPQSQQDQKQQDKLTKDKEPQQQQQQQQSQQVDQQSQKQQQQVVQQQPIVEQVAQQQQQQQIQQPQQQQQQLHTQYQQMYHPTHQMVMPMVSHLHPAVYQSDLVNFYNNLFYPNPITYSSPSSYLQQISQQQQQPINQATQQSSGQSQVLTMSMPLSQQIQQFQQQQQQQQPHYPSAGFMLSQSPYDFLFSPRLGKREVRSSMVAGEQQQQQNEETGKYDYEQDNDESRFLKIRLSLGPISIYRPFEKQEAVSCSLNLINIDTLMSEYQNKIVEMIDTSEYQQIEDEEAYEERLQQHVRKHQNDEPDHNDMMFMLDTGKNADPAAEIRKHKTAQQQEEMMNKVRDKSIAELIEMERQLNKMSAMSAAATSSLTFSFATALICVFIALIF